MRETDTFTRPYVYRPVLCRLGFHRHERLSVTDGMIKRSVFARRGCAKCGRIDMRYAYGMWLLWGYIRPEHIHMDPMDMLVKYLGPVPK